MISPPAFVTVMAAPNERHGADSAQLLAVFASAPLGETNVRCAEACAVTAGSATTKAVMTRARLRRRLRRRRTWGIGDLRWVGGPCRGNASLAQPVLRAF